MNEKCDYCKNQNTECCCLCDGESDFDLIDESELLEVWDAY